MIDGLVKPITQTTCVVKAADPASAWMHFLYDRRGGVSGLVGGGSVREKVW